MERLEKITSSFIFFLLCLLGFLLVFEQYVTIPYWLQPLGRMHPMVLHFPIALIVVLVILDLFRSHLDPASFEKIHKVLLYFTVVTTTLSAIMGFFLSREDSYASNLMTLHKWIGVSVSYLVYILLLTDPTKWGYKITLYSSLVILFFAGHFGAGLTHGLDFVMEPILKAKKKEITKDSPIFEAFVEPVLEAKCKSCHNPQKHKGELDMTTFDLMRQGGENGPVWVAGNPEESEIIVRAMLPLEHEHHMPPEGKAQLTVSELDFLKSWIKAGAGNQITMAELSISDTLFKLANQQMKAQQNEPSRPIYDFDFAGEKLLASLNNPYRSVVQETPGSPALDVNIFVRQAFKTEHLSGLRKIKEQIVSLNLAYMPVRDEDLSIIGKFINLEKLNLNHTDITSNVLAYLHNCKRLESLALSGTTVDMGISEELGTLKALKNVYLWNTALSEQDFEALISRWPEIRFYEGYSLVHEAPIRLSAPLLKNKIRIIDSAEKIILEHKLSGVAIRYTTDGTDPDSISSPLYGDPFEVQPLANIKTIAQKEGWLTSEVAAYQFFIKGLSPVEATFINQPNKKYKGKGALSLIDNEKGNATNFTGKSWLGYKKKPFSALIDFGENPPRLQHVVLGYGINMGSYIMPPVLVELWGGNDRQKMKKIKRVDLTPPTEYQVDQVSGVSLKFTASNYRYYKIIAQPVTKLPKWHSGKGEPGWVFVDELFFYP